MSTVSDVLTVTAVSKRYPGTQALDQVSLSILPGEIHALAGQNGAGKSTLIRLFAGVEDPDEGTISFRGTPVKVRHENLPINFIHQDLGLVTTMTVAENFALSIGYPRKGGLIDWKELSTRTQAALDALESNIDPGTLVGDLSMGQRSLVAIARAMATEADVIVLDEPTAALTVHDVDVLFEALRRLRERNVAMLYVTHRLDEVFRLANRVTVLRDGQVITTRAIEDISFGELVEAIAGRPIDRFFPTMADHTDNVVLEVNDLMVETVGPVSFELHAGEILGLAGLRGAGQETIGRGLFGAEHVLGGDVRVDDSDLHYKSAGEASLAEAMTHGFGFVSGRRQEEGLGGLLTIRENLFFNPRWAPVGATHWRSWEHRQARTLVDRFGIVPSDPERVVLTLSGGNQQKVLLARWIQANSHILILEEPTAGVDVGAKTELYGAIAELCAAGRACLLVSSDFDEVAGIAHRTLVFDRGRAVKELVGKDLTSSMISLYASGGSTVANDRR